MDITTLRNLYGRARIDDRQVNELIGLAHGIIADGKVNQAEAEYLYKWLAAHKDATENTVVTILFDRIKNYLEDDVLDQDEAEELFETLRDFAGGDYEIGEAQKSTSLPFCQPVPDIAFNGNRFCFTGTFGFGSRRQCEQAALEVGAIAGSLTKTTRFLVIGAYATESWAHSSYGRKIEKAVGMRSSGLPISIISEAHWVEALRAN